MKELKLDEYLELQKGIWDYFGYVEDWCSFPIDDCREMYWMLLGENEVQYSERIEDLRSEEENYYVNEIISPFLPKGIYRGEDCTMVVVDTNTDHNRFLQIFDNKKEVKE